MPKSCYAAFLFFGYESKKRTAPLTTCFAIPSLQFQVHLEHVAASGDGHPKMAALRATVLDHFSRANQSNFHDQAIAGATNAMEPSRCMVFTSLRESVSAIVAMLDRLNPMVSARWVLTRMVVPAIKPFALSLVPGMVPLLLKVHEVHDNAIHVDFSSPLLDS